MMKNYVFFLILLMTTQPLMAQTHSLSGYGSNNDSERALLEFEASAARIRQIALQIEQGTLAQPLTVKQRDSEAKEIRPTADIQSYKSAVTDPFYGYQTFILVDKSVSIRLGKSRDPHVRRAQTMYVFIREFDQLKLVRVAPVSTGREAELNKQDTREGYLRVQNAEKDYVSVNYGEAMPYSLWFESEYGTAIHETLQKFCDIAIGVRASPGCVRLCPGDAKEVFDLATRYPRTSPIVLVNKRTGVPIARGSNRSISETTDSQGAYLGIPKVIQGYPTFVRIIDGDTPEKVQEIESLIADPTTNFRQYFKPFSEKVLLGLTM